MHYTEPLDGVYALLCNHSCLNETLSTQRLTVISTVEKVGGGIGQDAATEVTHVELHSTFTVWMHKITPNEHVFRY